MSLKRQTKLLAGHLTIFNLNLGRLLILIDEIGMLRTFAGRRMKSIKSQFLMDNIIGTLIT